MRQSSIATGTIITKNSENGNRIRLERSEITDISPKTIHTTIQINALQTKVSKSAKNSFSRR